MAEIALRSWDSVDLQRIFDNVLVRSGVEFRRALRLLGDCDSVRSSQYVEYLREGLRAVEAELARRGINIEAVVERGNVMRPRRPEAPERTLQHERGPVLPPRTRQFGRSRA